MMGRRFILSLVACFVGFAGILYMGVDFAEDTLSAQEEVQNIDEQIKALKSEQERYRTAARRNDNEGQRLQFQDKQLSKRAYQKADLARERVKELDAKIDALNARRAELLRENPEALKSDESQVDIIPTSAPIPLGAALSAEEPSDQEITGFWNTIDKHTKRPNSIIAIYAYQGKYYGRIIATYNRDGVMDDTIYAPKDRAEGIEGHPFYSGLDIVFNAEPRGNGKYRGYVVDPRKGKVYDAELWRRREDLILRGEVFIFGRNEKWPACPEESFNATFKKPDLATFVPVIPKVAD